MATTKLNIFLLTALLAVATTLHVSTAQTTHVVGDAMGWLVPSGGSVAYVTWAARQTFTVGDRLIFNFTTQIHDVAEVNSSAFDSCNGTNPISMNTNGPANITLTTAGAHFYICTFTRHCDLGQKLAVNVSAPPPSSNGPSPAPISPAPEPARTPSPTAAATPSPAPSPSSPSPSSSPTPSPTAATTPSSAPSPSSPSPRSNPAPGPSSKSPSGSGANEPSSPTPPGTSSNPPPPPNAATSLASATVLPVTLLSIALAFLY